MFWADWPHMRQGSTRPIHSWKIIGEILLLWSGNCIGTATFSRKMHLNWKFCIIPCTGQHISLFDRCNIKFEIFSKNIQYDNLSTATLRSQAIVEWSAAQHFPPKSSMFSSFAVKTQMYPSYPIFYLDLTGTTWVFFIWP
jgi:hypothetical protein